MKNLKIGIQLTSLRMPFRRALAVAASLGATGVELDARGELRPRELGQTGVRELRRLLQEHALEVAAIRFETRRGYEMPDELERRIDATKEVLKFAADLRAAVVVNQFGRIPPDERSQAWTLLVESLSDLGSYGHRVGALLAGRTGPDAPDDIERLLGALPGGSVGLDLDPGRLLMNNNSPLEVVTRLGRHILHVHARDGVRDFTRGSGIEVPLGRGSADFPVLAAALEAASYRGFLTIARDTSENPQFEIEQAVKYLQNL